MGGNADRMLTWQWAKYLYDRGLLYVGRFSPKPGMHVFFGNKDNHPDTYLGIYHCGIVTNAIGANITGGKEQYWGIDCGGISTSPTTNTIAERLFNYSEMVACFYPTNIGIVQNVQDGFNYLINTNNEWTRTGTSSVDVLFNTTSSPVTLHYKATFSNDSDGTKGGIDTDLTIPAFHPFRIVRVAKTVTLTNAKGIRIMGETFPGLAQAANQNTANDK